MAHDWPTLEFMENAKRYKISDIPPLAFLSENILETNPLTLPLWLGGLIWLLIARSARSFRIVGLIFIATWVLLVLQKSKPYYFAASFPVMLAAGGVAWERWTRGNRWRWARWLLLATLIAGLAIFAPLALPLLTPEGLDAYQSKLGIAPAAQEVGHNAALPQYFSDRFGWENLARTVSEVYTELPAEERGRVVVIGSNYGHAGALEYWSKRYDLPPVYSVHNTYWLWGPPPIGPDDVVIVTTSNPERSAERCESAIEAGVATTPWAQESRISVLVCRGLKQPIDELWQEVKTFI
jgi:hypothetical protein